MSSEDLGEIAQRAAAGDRAAARKVVESIAAGVYELALRMLGHPADAEDAAQEILVVVVTHLGSFRGESAFSTWVWRIAANHLVRVRRGRRETMSFELLDERLTTGLASSPASGPEAAALAAELRLRCTSAMLLSLDRDLRLAHVLGDIFGFSGEICAAIVEIEPAAFRKRLTRARARLYEFMGGWCGVFDEANPCRCEKQVDAMQARALISADDLYLLRQESRAVKAASEVDALMRMAEVLRGDRAYAAPEAMVARVREVLEAHPFELFEN